MRTQGEIEAAISVGVTPTRNRNRRANAPREIVAPDGRNTVSPGSPKILIHTRQGKCVWIYCD